MKTIYAFTHIDENKLYTDKQYTKEFETELEAFKYLYRRNRQQSYCYGCIDSINDVFLNSRYNSWLSSLCIGERVLLES